MILTQENYIQKAEDVIKQLANRKDERTGRPVPMVTTSKLRNILAMASDIYNEVLNCQDEKLPPELCERIDYMQIRMVYEYGREKEKEKVVREFLMQTQLIECVKEIGASKQNYIRFNRYLEALVAYHRFYGGKES